MFDIPKHAIPALLALNDKENLCEEIMLWAEHMQAFTVGNAGLFTAQRRILDNPPELNVMTLLLRRMELLADLFKQNISIQTSVHERLVVETNGEEYRLRHESIGRYREWQWIDQRNTEYFPLDRPRNVLQAIVERFGNPHALSTVSN